MPGEELFPEKMANEMGSLVMREGSRRRNNMELQLPKNGKDRDEREKERERKTYHIHLLKFVQKINLREY